MTAVAKRTAHRDAGGRRLTDAEVEIRRGDVEDVMVTRGLNMKTRGELMAKWGIARSQLHGDVEAIRARWGEDLERELKDPRRELLAETRALQFKASGSSETYPSAARFIDIRAKMTGAYVPLQVLHGGKVDVEVTNRTLAEDALAMLRGFALAFKALGTDPAMVIDVPKLEAFISTKEKKP